MFLSLGVSTREKFFPWWREICVAIAQFRQQAREFCQPGITQQIVGGIFLLNTAAQRFNQWLI